MERNICRLKTRLDRLGVSFRPHLKTAKSLEVARRAMNDPGGPAAVSTLKEAEEFAAGGVRDLLYAVGIAPSKLTRVIALRRRGIDLSLILDSVEQARAVVDASQSTADRIPSLIEIDSDGHRSGVPLGDTARLIAIGNLLNRGAALRGILTHAGDSYHARGLPALEACAEQERKSAVKAAQILQEAGLPCPVVSVGSTPTAFFARDMNGVTEVRAGVFMFFDLIMAGIGVCTVDDIALSVAATVIGHQREKQWTLIDAGWMALSRDRGTAQQAVDQGYGIVCNVEGKPFDDLIVLNVNQEHGIIARRPGKNSPLPDLSVGTLVRILPNHACATAAQYDQYNVVRSGATQIHARWRRFNGW